MGDNVVGFIFTVLYELTRLYCLVVLVHVILGLLVAFNVVNSRNQFVGVVWQITARLVEPVLARIRRWLPFLRNVGGFDLTPVILLVVLYAINLHFFWPLSQQGY